MNSIIPKLSRIPTFLQKNWQAAANRQQISRSQLMTFAYHLAEYFRFTHGWAFPFQWKGISFWARHIDTVALEEVLLQEEYGFVRQLLLSIGEKPIVIDAGANIGMFSLYSLSIRPDALVWSIEPGLSTFRLLKHNAHVSRKPGWQAVRLALWKENTTLTFDNREASTSSRVASFSETPLVLEQVQAMRLADFVTDRIQERINLLKLDIEGAEEAVLETSESLLPSVDYLIVEIHPYWANEDRVMSIIRRHFAYVYPMTGRTSTKPLIVASHTPVELNP